ncbi:MAG: NAD(P)H-hydrate dehydratase [Tenericutes bacterium]|nr:NAD(P)H-hydrate dehydratase [Mycoplasmatota bacterium]
MNQVVTIEQMRKIEELTMQKQQISSFDLIEKAGKAMYQSFCEDHHKPKSLFIICGKGNNGLDALAFGLEAHLNNHQVTAIILSEIDKDSESIMKLVDAYEHNNMPLYSINQISDLIKKVNHNPNIDVLIDGIFGIGLSKEVKGLYEEVIDWINQQQYEIISLDLPSGLHADTGKIMGTAVKADVTLTVHAFKVGLLINDGLDCSKTVKVVDIGMEPIENQMYLYQEMKPMPKRLHHTHKYHYKSVLTIGGQVGVMGAITLAGHSALVSGAGLSTIATHQNHQNHYIYSVPEIMYDVIIDQKDMLRLLEKKDAVLFGLGIKKPTSFEQLVFDTLIDSEIPLILDALGIMYLKQHKKRFNKRVIITPHYGEFAKLMDIDVTTLQNDILTYMNKCINLYNCEIVLKGPSTIYANKDKITFLNQGTPALAKAGSGDVLSGIILTFAARDLPIEQAILLHMLAGNKASKSKHIESVLATDIIESIPIIYNEIQSTS